MLSCSWFWPGEWHTSGAGERAGHGLARGRGHDQNPHMTPSHTPSASTWIGMSSLWFFLESSRGSLWISLSIVPVLRWSYRTRQVWILTSWLILSEYFLLLLTFCFYFLISKLWIMDISYKGGVGWSQRELQVHSSWAASPTPEAPEHWKYFCVQPSYLVAKCNLNWYIRLFIIFIYPS